MSERSVTTLRPLSSADVNSGVAARHPGTVRFRRQAGRPLRGFETSGCTGCGQTDGAERMGIRDGDFVDHPAAVGRLDLDPAAKRLLVRIERVVATVHSGSSAVVILCQSWTVSGRPARSGEYEEL